MIDCGAYCVRFTNEGNKLSAVFELFDMQHKRLTKSRRKVSFSFEKLDEVVSENVTHYIS